MHLDPALPTVVGLVLAVLTLGVVLRAAKQPYVVAYLLAGVALGPHAIGLVTDVVLVERLGAYGVMLLLFFVGMEVSPRQLTENWKVPVVGTVLSIAASVGVAAILGWAYAWPLSRVVLIGFVISLSSTAVVLKVLADRKELTTRVGRNVLGVLLVQDLAVVPMMVVVGFLGGGHLNGSELALQIVGAVALSAGFAYLTQRSEISFPLLRWLGGDREMQVFAALALVCCLGLVTGLAHLSTPLGAFAAGMIVGAARETHWVHESLEPFRVVFVALFFVSVGLSVDLHFLRESWVQVALLLGAAITINVVVMTLIARALGETWGESLYSGLILSQVGEFGFLLAAVGSQSGIITAVTHQLAILVISTSLLVSPALIALGHRLLRRSAPAPGP